MTWTLTAQIALLMILAAFLVSSLLDAYQKGKK